jgi:hypothetical protein
VGKLNSRPYQDLDVLGTPVQYGLGDHFAMDSRLLVKKPGGGQADLGVLFCNRDIFVNVSDLEHRSYERNRIGKHSL